jgi:putative hydrolase
MSPDVPPDRPSDDELPPDPFPGDPFAVEEPAPTGKQEPSGSPDLSELLGSLGPMGSLFQQIAAMQQTQGSGLNWDVARQIALWTASGQHVESPPDPVERIKMEQIVGNAAKEVATASGLDVSAGVITAVVTTRAGWAAQSLEDHRSLLDRLATSLAAKPSASSADDERDPLAAMLGMIAPMMISTQAGALIGELATTSLGSYDIPVPRTRDKDQLLFVLRNIDEFASEWSVPVAQARTHVAIVETATHAVLRLPHINKHLHGLIERFVGSYVLDPDALGEHLRDQFDSLGNDPGAIQDAFQQDPSVLFGASETQAQRSIRADISRVLTPIVGFVDYVAAVTGARMLGDNRKVVEAWRRHRLSPGKGKSSAAQMLGMALDDDLLDRGAIFIGGVLQRGGPDALATLWSGPEQLPTEAEIAAPGLWLARVGLAD